MFRKMRRWKQQISNEKCIELLRTEKRGVLSVIIEDGYPYGVPVNYIFDEKENTIYIHGAKEGLKIDSINNCDKVCFTVWDKGYKKEGDWAYNVASVISFGRAEIIKDLEVITCKVRNLGNKYYPSPEEVDDEIKQSISHVGLIAIHIEHMTGKLIYEK